MLLHDTLSNFADFYSLFRFFKQCLEKDVIKWNEILLLKNQATPKLSSQVKGAKDRSLLEKTESNDDDDQPSSSTKKKPIEQGRKRQRRLQPEDEASNSDNEQPTSSASKGKGLYFVKSNPYAPSLDNKKMALKGKEGKQLIAALENEIGGEFDAAQFPWMNFRGIKTEYDCCLICEDVVYPSLREHFNHHVEDGQAEESQYIDYLLYSRAKKYQLMANPTILIDEIASAIRLGGVEAVNKIADAFKLRGIDVVSKKGEFQTRPPKAGQHPFWRKIPDYAPGKMRRPELKQTEDGRFVAFKPIPEADQKLWEAGARALLLHKANPLPKSGEVEPAKIPSYLQDLKQPSEDHFPQITKERIDTIRAAWIKPADTAEAKAAPHLFTGPKRGLKKLPPLSSCKDVLKVQLSDLPIDTMDTMGDEEKKTLLFYCTIIRAFVPAKLELRFLTYFCRFLRGAIQNLQNDDANVKAFYADKEDHLKFMYEGTPKQIYAKDIEIMASYMRIKMLLAYDDGRKSSTYLVDTTGMKETLCLTINADGQSAGVIRSF